MSAPAELLQIGLDPAKFRRATANEWHGPCPRCGGTDRLRVHTDRPWPHWYVVCREGTGCGWKGWADELEPALRRQSDGERERWAEQARIEREREDARRAARLADFTTSELWDELHRRMTAGNRAWWTAQGLDPVAQDYWHLGYTGSAFEYGPAYTIPYFTSGSGGWQAVNMQYRLVSPPQGGDKYRWAGLGHSSFFTAHPDLGVTDEVFVCEGAKKAMVYTYRLSLEAVQVYAVPSKADFAGLPATLAGVGRAWVILDPDADEQAVTLAAAIGDGARVVTLTEKLDDAILRYGLDYATLSAYLRQAAKP